MYKTIKELLEKPLTLHELLRIKYQGAYIGFVLDTIRLDDLISVEDFEALPISKSINTECGLLTWVLSTGWILVPCIDEELNWYKFETLSDFLEKNKVCINTSSEFQEQVEGAKVRLLREYIDELHGALEKVNMLLKLPKGKLELELDLFISLIKDFGTPGTENLVELQEEILKEIQSMNIVLMNLLSNKKQRYSIA